MFLQSRRDKLDFLSGSIIVSPVTNEEPTHTNKTKNFVTYEENLLNMLYIHIIQEYIINYYVRHYSINSGLYPDILNMFLIT